MKKILLSLALLAASAATYAQIPAGSMMLGGTIGFSTSSGKTDVSGAATSSTDHPTVSSFSLSPTFGYFLSDNMAVGAMINFSNGSSTTKGSYDQTTGASNPTSPTANSTAQDFKTATSSFGISLFANKYNELSEKWMWYYGANLGYMHGGGTATMIKQTGPGAYSASDVDAPSTNTISLGANIGALYWLNEHWALQASLNNLLAFNFIMSSSESTTGSGASAVTVKSSDNTMNLTAGTGNFGVGAVSVGLFYFIK